MQTKLNEAQETLDILAGLPAIRDLERSINFAIEVPKKVMGTPSGVSKTIVSQQTGKKALQKAYNTLTYRFPLAFGTSAARSKYHGAQRTS